MHAFRPVLRISRLRFPAGRVATVLLLSLSIAGCGGQETPPGGSAGGPDALTPQELENGIGPVTSVELAPIEAAMAEEGAALYKTKCSACHKLDQRYIGPELGAVLERRTPEFVMNMMLNPEEMTQRHPVARALLAEYAAPMANQSLTVEQARAILEYIRASASDA